ncbi:MAG: PEP-CTERM sorting domain-containing protein [Gammaproteobacteria bacterium]|nr:PEP-CTERM sorting domain-containing protein [Gammaproteobacteria bacterium]
MHRSLRTLLLALLVSAAGAAFAQLAGTDPAAPAAAGVPEPRALALVGVGLLIIAGLHIRRRRRR